MMYICDKIFYEEAFLLRKNHIIEYIRTTSNRFGVNIYKNADAKSAEITTAAEKLLETRTVKFESNKYSNISLN